MADHGLAVAWGEVKPGRESKTLELWSEAVVYNEKLVADGKVERWEAVLFEPSGSYPSGTVRYYGTAEQMGALAESEEFLRIVTRGQLLFLGFGFRRFATGQAMMDAVGQFAGVIESL